jgi:PRTRC genetic system ThiF family protein
MFCLHNYLANPTHNINVTLIGVGGTGSFILPELVALSESLKQLDKRPLNIKVFDPDIVEQHNIGRQKFFPPDIGKYKAEVLTTRVNRAYGSNVQFFNKEFLLQDLNDDNIIITCVDNVKLRRKLAKHLPTKPKGNSYKQTYYWIDAGNSRDYGQIVLASYSRKKKEQLPSIIDLYPEMEDKPEEPSCSMRASLNEQSFMINKLTGIYVMEMLSALLIDMNIGYSQVYFNLTPPNVKTNTI